MNTMGVEQSSAPHYPTFSIDLEHLPEAKNWQVGKTYKIELEVKQTGLHIGQSAYDNRAEFDIIGIDTSENKSKPKAPRYP